MSNRFLGIVVVALACSSPVSAQDKQCPSLRALDGTCADAGLVNAGIRRGLIVSGARTSYVGTPAGSVAPGPIPYERLFKDDPIVYGLPTQTNTFFTVGVPPCDFPCSGGPPPAGNYIVNTRTK